MEVSLALAQVNAVEASAKGYAMVAYFVYFAYFEYVYIFAVWIAASNIEKSVLVIKFSTMSII